MKTIAITGASGLIGTALREHLVTCGYHVVGLGRVTNDGEFGWNPATGTIKLKGDVHADAVVHLAGESVVGRWTAQKKRDIDSSRGIATHKLAQFLAAMPQPPEVLVSASAIGIYGNRGEELLDENSMAGTGFLAGVATRWEDAAAPARAAGIRVVHPRIGVVLSSRGGALAAMLPAFKLGAGATIGNGSQWQSWISLDDAVRAITHALEHPLVGPMNLVAPHAVTNGQLTRTLAKQLKRSALLKIPAFALRAALGEAADEMLLSSTHVVPRVLEQSDFIWNQPTLDAALAHELG